MTNIRNSILIRNLSEVIVLAGSEKNVKIKCKFCRDKGIKGGCPKCQKALDKIVITQMQESDGIVTDEVTLANIPEFYRGRVWDKNELIQAHKELDGKNQFNTFVSQLSKVHSMFMEGTMPRSSAIIIAPRKFSKQIWANSCIQFGMQTGHKMLPVMSSNLIKITMANMFDRPGAQVLKNVGYTIDDIMTADCLFVNIDTGWQHINAFSLIDELMCMRSNFDRPTIFLSRFNIEEITKGDYNGTFKDAIDIGADVNRLRYPAIIQCTG